MAKLPLLFVALAIIYGCASTPPPKFYSLAAAPGAAATVSDGPGLRIGIFLFPDYLRRPNIVTRAGGGQIEVAEFDRWAGSLENDFLLVLGSQLGAGLGTSRVSVYPAESRFKPDYVITGEIVSFDGALGGEVTLDVHWVVTETGGEQTVSAKRSAIMESAGDATYPSLVEAHLRAVKRLSAEIEAEVRRLQSGG
jgi:uncharacterized lipoprotein YmbA